MDDTTGTAVEPFTPTTHQWAAALNELDDTYPLDDEGELPELAKAFAVFGKAMHRHSGDTGRDSITTAREVFTRLVVAAYSLGEFGEVAVSLVDAGIQDIVMSVVRVPTGQEPGATRIVFWVEYEEDSDIVPLRFELINLTLIKLTHNLPD